MQKISKIDPVSQLLIKQVSSLNSLNNPKYYHFLEKIEDKLLPITKRRVIIPHLRRYRQQQIGKYGLYNWYFNLWGLSKPLQPEYLLAKSIVLFSAALIIAALLSFLSIALSLIVALIGYIVASKTLSAPQSTAQSLRDMALMHYPQAASVFAARNVTEMIEILQEVEVLGYEVQSLISHYITSQNPSSPNIESVLAEYLNRHPLSSVSLIKDILDSFKTVNLDVRKQQKFQIMRQFPGELTEYFNRVTYDYKQIQTTALMFSEMIVFASFMVLAIFNMIETPIALLVPALVIIFSDSFMQPVLLRSISVRLFFNYNLAELEKSLRKKNWKAAYSCGAIVSIFFGLMVPDPFMGILSIIIGIPALGYMFSSVFAVATSELEYPITHLHTLIREHIAIISAIRKEVGEVSMLYAFKNGILRMYNGPLEDQIKPIVNNLQMNASIHDVLNDIYNTAYAQSTILRPYLFFIERIIHTSPIKGKSTETNPSELFDMVYEVTSQVLRPLASKFESIILTGTSRANFTGIINGLTTGIFVVLGKIFTNVLSNGLGSMGNILGPSGGDMGSWMYEFMSGMLGTINGTELVAAALVSLSGTYLGVYPFQSNRTKAYAISVFSAVICSYFGFKLMEMVINMMVNLV